MARSAMKMLGFVVIGIVGASLLWSSGGEISRGERSYQILKPRQPVVQTPVIQIDTKFIKEYQDKMSQNIKNAVATAGHRQEVQDSDPAVATVLTTAAPSTAKPTMNLGEVDPAAAPAGGNPLAEDEGRTDGEKPIGAHGLHGVDIPKPAVPTPPVTEVPYSRPPPEAPLVVAASADTMIVDGVTKYLRANLPRCEDDSKCQNPACMMVGYGHCRPNPYFDRYSYEKVAFKDGDETVCADAPAPSKLPELPPLPANGKPASEADKLAAFKHFTGLPFKKWYDWKTTCVPRKGAEAEVGRYRYTAAHQNTRDQHYVIKNLCIRPNGALAGFQPHAEQFMGGDDVRTIVEHEDASYNAIRRYFTEVNGMSEPASCFYDRKLLIMPLRVRVDNPGHCFMRMAQLLDIKNKIFPRTKPEDVTVMYIVPDGNFKEFWTAFFPKVNPMRWKDTGFNHYTTVVSHSHFMVYSQTMFRDHVWNEYGVAKDPRLSEPICFSEATVYQTCHISTCRAAKRNQPVHADIYPLYMTRSARIQEDFMNRLRDCAGVVKRPTPNRKHPHVLYSVRTQIHRSWATGPMLLSAMGEYVTKRGGTFQTHEMSNDGALELIRIYNRADAVIGQYGAGLFYAIGMPVGSVGIELHIEQSKCMHVQPALNSPQNHFCDYGGNFNAAQVHYILDKNGVDNERELIAFNKGSGKWTVQIDVKSLQLHHLLDRAWCLIGKSEQYSKPGATFPGQGWEKCNRDHNVLMGANHNWVIDQEGIILKALARMWHRTNSVGSRLPWIYRNAKAIAEAIREKTHRADASANVLLVVPCTYDQAIEDELFMWRAYLARHAKLAVWSPEDRKPECRGVAGVNAGPNKVNVCTNRQVGGCGRHRVIITSSFLKEDNSLRANCNTLIVADVSEEDRKEYLPIPHEPSHVESQVQTGLVDGSMVEVKPQDEAGN